MSSCCVGIFLGNQSLNQKFFTVKSLRPTLNGSRRRSIPPTRNIATEAMPGLSNNNVFRQAMLKAGLDQIPQLTEENFSIWKDKMSALLKLRGVLTKLESPDNIALDADMDAELTFLIILKIDSVVAGLQINRAETAPIQPRWLTSLDRCTPTCSEPRYSVTHNNVDHFASLQASNRAQIFNEFLYIKFKEETVETFIMEVKFSIKKLVDVGIDLPQDILAYLILFKFPDLMQALKRQVMHSDKELTVEFKFQKAESSGNVGKRCKTRYHNPKQNSNHDADSCWHLHPERAPEWWRDAQAKWEASKRTNYFMSLVTLWIESGSHDSKIILDSGSSSHIFNDPRFFEHLELGDLNVMRTGKKDANLPIKGQGTVLLQWGKIKIALENCLFVPNIIVNLISPGLLDKKGCLVNARNGNFVVKKLGQNLFGVRVLNNMYSVRNPDKIGSNVPFAGYSMNSSESLRDIHEKYGHASLQRIKTLLLSNISNEEKLNFECKACILSKITKHSFKLESRPTSKVFERIHLDLVGPILPPAKNQSKYILTVVDNFSGYIAGFPLINKDDTTNVLINLLEAEKNPLGYLPNMVCSDGGGEFVGARLVSYLEGNHIKRLISEPYHPKHNVLKSCCIALNQIPREGNFWRRVKRDAWWATMFFCDHIEFFSETARSSIRSMCSFSIENRLSKPMMSISSLEIPSSKLRCHHLLFEMVKGAKKLASKRKMWKKNMKACEMKMKSRQVMMKKLKKRSSCLNLKLQDESFKIEIN
ncbi:hypothetical protein VP01_1836g6 [Puccinia sorghi]|uniref:Integrase catalytic domain-containing protein n=1 Tax=Puccinia sorghi TaxID=27349 RepID=A0A0L6VFN7_9BASI|nr:hypothetical protein VP01_1836g6 [Puccinia sorghi]